MSREPTTAPPDHAARQRIVSGLDTTMFVDAGAGSGKTTALVGRIVQLVLSGVRMRQIAAITFTEAAAAELRDRVRAQLEQIATAADSAHDAARAADAIAEVDLAAISTLHGFAQRILVAHAIEAELPPRVAVVDQVGSVVAFARRWDLFLQELLDSDSAEDVIRAGICGITPSKLETIAREFNWNWDLLAPDPATMPAERDAVRGGELRRLLTVATSLRSACTDPADKLLEHLEQLQPFLARLRSTDDGVDLLRLLATRPRLRCGKGRKDNWPDVAQVRELLVDAENEAQRLVLDAARDALSRLLEQIRVLTLDAALRRRLDGQLEFHDLLVLCRDLLRRKPQVCASLRERWPRLLIDEFQDTDPIQAELAMRIAGTGDPDAPWQDLDVEPGRLFFVGDPKQAIYRFRRADIELFMQMQERVGRSGERLTLSTCFRSVPSIISWVNSVFGHLLGDGVPGKQPPYEPLLAHRPGAVGGGGTPAVVALGGPQDEATAGEIRAAAGEDVARVIRRALAERWTVGDSSRPLRLADIALLLPTTTELAPLVAALDQHGIPYRLEMASLLFSSPEVNDLMTALRAVDDPSDELAVVGALRSPLYGCGDDDLAAWRSAGGGWDHTRIRSGIDGPVADALEHLSSLHDARRWCDPATIVERLLSERCALHLATDSPRARDVWRRLRWIAEQARSFVERGGSDLRGWLRWMDALGSDQVRASEATLPEADDDAVRIMTIHHSKGLEFPFVVVCGLQQAPRTPETPRVLWGPQGPEVDLGRDLRTEGFAALGDHDREMDRHERLRLLYVAATRAQDHLVLPLHHVAGKDCHAATIGKVIEAHGVPVHRPDLAEDPPAPEQVDGVQVPDSPVGSPEERDEELDRRRQLLEDARRPSVIAPSSIASLASQARPSSPTDDPGRGLGSLQDDHAEWQRGRGGTAVGRAVHGVLQLVDLATGEGLADIARFQAQLEGVTDRAAQVQQLAAHALGADVIRTAAAAERSWRELYVGMPLGDRLMEGFVDLLFTEGDGCCLVDYKTAVGVDDAELRRRSADYALQAAAYAIAVEHLLDRPVTRCVLLYLRGDGVVEHELSDLGAARSRVLELVGAGA